MVLELGAPHPFTSETPACLRASEEMQPFLQCRLPPVYISHPGKQRKNNILHTCHGPAFMSQAECRGIPSQGGRHRDQRRQTDRGKQGVRVSGDKSGSAGIDMGPAVCQLCSAQRAKDKRAPGLPLQHFSSGGLLDSGINEVKTMPWKK